MDEQKRGYLPRTYRDLRADYPDLAAAYDGLGDACRQAGPLSARDQRLVKLGIALGLSSDGGVRSHVRRGLDEGISAEELLHADRDRGFRPRASRPRRRPTAGRGS